MKTDDHKLHIWPSQAASGGDTLLLILLGFVGNFPVFDLLVKLANRRVLLTRITDQLCT